MVGTIQMWPKSTAPAGYLLCDGSAYNTTTYAALYAVLNVGTLPDFRGVFPRGYDPTNFRDPDTRNVLSIQTDAYENHSHNVPSQTITTSSSGNHNHTITYKNTSSG